MKKKKKRERKQNITETTKLVDPVDSSEVSPHINSGDKLNFTSLAKCLSLEDKINNRADSSGPRLPTTSPVRSGA